MILFRNLNMIDGISDQVQERKAILVEGERIAEITDDRDLTADRVIDLQGRYVTPGLIDAHVHLISPFVPKVTPRNILHLNSQIRRNLQVAVKQGVTTVRDTAGFPRKIQGARRMIDQGRLPGPRIVCANSFITCFGGTPEWIPYLRGPAKLIAGGQAVERVKRPEQAAAVVRKMVKLGADWIKTSYGDKPVCIGKGAPPTMSDETYEAIFKEAGRLGKPVAFNQMFVSAFRKGLIYKPATFEHIPMDGLLNEADVSSLVKAGIAVVAALDSYKSGFEYERAAGDLAKKGKDILEPVPYKLVSSYLDKFKKRSFTAREIEKDWLLDPEIPEKGMADAYENLRRLWKSGAVIGCGSDAGGAYFQFFGFFYREIANLVEMGMTPCEALRCATAVNARILRLDRDLGTLEPGKYADLLVVDGNPLDDISNLARVRAVYKGGRPV